MSFTRFANPAIYWIERTPGPGRLAVSARPRGSDWLDDEIGGWKSQGIDTVVSLLEPDESRQLDLIEEARLSSARGIDFRSFPIADRRTPESIKDAKALIQELSQQLLQGRNILIHCRQGVGRSGMIAAAILMENGLELPDALRLIRNARGVEIPETPEQSEWLYRYIPQATSNSLKAPGR